MPYHNDSKPTKQNRSDSTEMKSEDGHTEPSSTLESTNPSTAPEMAMLGNLLESISCPPRSNTDMDGSSGKASTAAAATSTPDPSPEDMLSSLKTLFDEMMDVASKIPEIANQEIPTASIPTHIHKSDRSVPKASVYMSMSIENFRESTKSFLDEVGSIFHAMDSTLKPQAGPQNTPGTSGTSSPPTVTLHDFIRATFSSPFADTSRDNGGATFQRSPLVTANVFDTSIGRLTRQYQTNETLIRSTLQGLYAHANNVPEDDSRFPFIVGITGLTLLHLYEVIWDDEALEAGCDGTALALQKLLQLPQFQMLQSGPIVVRCWAYGQRLAVRKDGDINRLDATVAMLRQGWDIYQDLPGIPPRVMEFLRTELAICLLDHYRATGNLADLNDCIDHLFSITENEEISSPTSVALGMACYDRFLHLGVLDDLDRALYRGQQACDIGLTLLGSLKPNYDADTASGHHLFSLALAERFKMTMDVEDLDKAVRNCSKAIELLHPSHPLRLPYTASLATILHARHDTRAEGVDDIHRALNVLRPVLENMSDNLGRHSRVPGDTIMGYLIVVDGEAKKDLSAIDSGIKQIRRSRKNFSGPPHLESRIETYLSKAIICRFRQGADREDFELAIHHAGLAFSKAPEDSPYRFQCGLDLGRLLFEQFENGKSSNCDDAIAQYISVAMSPTWPSIRFNAAIEWANAAEASSSDGSEDALTMALEILPTIASLSSRMPAQYRLLSSQRASIPNRAAIYALNAGDVMKALSSLEKGRNVMWAQSLQLHAGHLLPAGDERTTEFKLLSGYLSKTRSIGRLTEELKEQSHTKHIPPALIGPQESAKKILEAAMKQWVELRGEAQVSRELETISEFRSAMSDVYMDSALHSSAKRWTTLHKELQDIQATIVFSDAQKADLIPILNKGPIIIVSAYALRCDAIIISSRGDEADFYHLTLPDLSGDEIQAWAETLRIGMHDFESGEIQLADFENEYLYPILRGLWTGLALPVLNYLKNIGAGKRVWWYPTGPLMFLPIHAASPCEGDELGLLDLLISSYIPSIHSLIRASKSPSLPLKVLAVGLPNTPGHTPLKFVEKEIKVLKKQFRDNPECLTMLMDEAADIYTVFSKLPEYSCVHLSCHAYQDEQYPFNSALFLHDGRLKLSRLMALDLSRVHFAFLSACLTSAGDTSLPDECIHLAAGMQFAGVGSVIGTMWSVMDRVAADAATKVYGHLFRNGVENVNLTEGAEALHGAIVEMREKKLPLAFIVPFIHLGF